MRLRETRALASLAVLLAVLGAAGCQSLFRQYEYEEEIYVKLNGQATMIVNASIPALMALRGFKLDPSPNVAVDREQIRALYESPVTHARVASVWRRGGRRFVQIRVDVDDIRRLSEARPFNWSTYQFAPDTQTAGEIFHYTQTMGDVAGAPPPGVNWNGSEIVAVRLHLPSRIEFHNALHGVERGNILSWEQPLRERLQGRPIQIDVRMQAQSILYRTLTVFGLALAAALAMMGGFVLWIHKKGRAATV
jgi:hypothetical protein